MTFATSGDLIGTLIAALLTLLVFFYIVGDNPLFRLTIHIFIGVSAGFAGAVAIRSVVIPTVINPLLGLAGGDFSLQNLLGLVPVVLSLLLLTKLFDKISPVGNIAMAYLVGIGAGVAIGGAVFGTLFPQVVAATDLLDLGTLQPNGFMSQVGEFTSRLIALVGIIATLIYFQFSARHVPNAAPQRPQWIETISLVGHGFIAITLGTIFAGVFAAALTALIERIQFLWTLLLSFM